MRWRKAPSIAATGRAGSILVILSLAAPAHAGDQYVILGAGSRPCGSWLRVRSQALPDSAVLQSWVLGYITSVNANVLTINQDVATGTSPDALFSWIDNYCAAHPLDSVARAASSLLDSLRSKHPVQ
jgi:hypothetical protein